MNRTSLPSRVGHDHEHRRRVEHGRDEVALLPQLALGPQPSADVGEGGHEAHHLPLAVEDRRRREDDVDRASVLAKTHRLEAVDRLSPAQPLADAGDLVTPVGGDEGDRLSQDFPGLPAEQGLGGGIPERDDAVEIELDDRDGRCVEQRSQPFLARPQILESGEELGLEAGVLERECGPGRDGVEELLVVGQRGIVDERADPAAVPLDERRRPARSGSRQLDCQAGFVHIGSGLRNPVSELERGVSECSGECFSQASRRLVLDEIDEQPDDREPREPRDQLARDERDRDQHEEDECDDEEDVRGRLRDEARHEGGREKRESEPARPDHRAEDPPGGAARRPPALDEDGDDREKADRADDLGDPVQSVGEAVSAVDQQQVRGTAVAVVRAGLVEEEHHELDEEDVDVDDGDDQPGDPRFEAAAREREQKMGEDPEGEIREEQADREGQGRVRRGEGDGEPGEALGDHQRAERVLRLPRPGEQAARDERPAEEQGQRGLEANLVGVVRRQNDGQRRRDRRERDGPDEPRMPA